MYVYSAEQIRKWDAYTIAKTPIKSIDLMEKAALTCCRWIEQHFSKTRPLVFICGPGNNGGDGLCMARHLLIKDYQLSVWLYEAGGLRGDALEQLERLELQPFTVNRIKTEHDFPSISAHSIVVDALFGTGLSRPLEGLPAKLVAHINSFEQTVISIDMPSGLPTDTMAINEFVVNATYTLSFQCPKFSFFLQEHTSIIGNWQLLDIGLLPAFTEKESSRYTYLGKQFMQTIKPKIRQKHAHKGNFGHACIAGGSLSMMGAVLMSLSSCLKSGVGLLTAAVPEEGFCAINTTIPEAMCAEKEQWMQHAFYEKKTAVAVGMGWVHHEFNGRILKWLLSNCTMPLLIDATALNILAQNKDWLALRPKGAVTILTPHIGEMHRLIGPCANSIERMEKTKNFASTHQVVVVLKGAYTQIVTPGGLIYFNSSGNPGMAKGGSGDALAGLLVGLLAQGYGAVEACLLAVYVHGSAGDIAARHFTQQGMTVTNLIDSIPEAWKQLQVH